MNSGGTDFFSKQSDCAVKPINNQSLFTQTNDRLWNGLPLLTRNGQVDYGGLYGN